MKTYFVVLALSLVLLLSGCAQMRNATEVAAVTSPIGALVHVPFWVGDTVSNMGSSQPLPADAPVYEGVPLEEGPVEVRRRNWHPNLPGKISREDYEALSDEQYQSLIEEADTQMRERRASSR
ncbi:hypothetical protein [Geoalkalibacter halelectricus]|uniref:hypothetical protein n=1 Tax=Geoalkalibacter halelectricus TaxID=2847045 RepID=UPI00266F8591|nr:hypothetical protein [Geoalkalibacter halelectricus]MDO3380428.1 hypothetical protein [Geoalkalibacter halelectricus]